MFSNNAYYSSAYIQAPPPYGYMAPPLPGCNGNPPNYSASRYSSSSYTYTPRTSVSSYTYPPFHTVQNSYQLGPSYRLSGGREAQYRPQQQQYHPSHHQHHYHQGHQSSIQYEHRIRMPQCPDAQSFAQIPRSIRQIIGRSRRGFMEPDRHDPEYGNGNESCGVSPQHVPRSAGYAYISVEEYNRRAREFNRESHGLLKPIKITDYDGSPVASKLCPDDENQVSLERSGLHANWKTTTLISIDQRG